MVIKTKEGIKTMNKKVVVIHRENQPVEVLEVKTFTDLDDFREFCKIAELNRKAQEEKKAEEQRKKDQLISDALGYLSDKLDRANLEIDLLRGRISNEEYEERIKEENE